jgi:hypothetical protein
MFATGETMKNKRCGLFLILIALILVSGCDSSTPKGKEDFPYDLMVNIHDLTDQFVNSGNEFSTIDGAFSFEIQYMNRNDKAGALVDHQITIYPDSKSANEDFANWEDKWFNESWVTPSESTFKPKNSDDLYKMGCMDTAINGEPTKSCELLQLHNNLIILVLTNINADNISFSTFDEILQKLDARLPSGDIPMPGQ